MFGFINKCFFTAMAFFSYNILNANYLECVSMNTQECKIRSEIIDVNTNSSNKWSVLGQFGSKFPNF